VASPPPPPPPTPKKIPVIPNVAKRREETSKTKQTMNRIQQLIQQLCPEGQLFQGITDSSLTLGMTSESLSG
jgi:hypothetical protein